MDVLGLFDADSYSHSARYKVKLTTVEYSRNESENTYIEIHTQTSLVNTKCNVVSQHSVSSDL